MEGEDEEEDKVFHVNVVMEEEYLEWQERCDWDQKEQKEDRQLETEIEKKRRLIARTKDSNESSFYEGVGESDGSECSRYKD
jgi:hypothetical protein